MGKILSLMTKPMREFNIESRAHAAISKEKPTPAPKHKADHLNYEHLLKDHPDTYNESLKKNEQLDKYLKNVFLTSHDSMMIDRKSQENVNPEKPLPLNRSIVQTFEYGFHEPKRIPLGKITIRKALRFISEHHVDAKVNNATKIAEEYLLPEKTVENILKYFKMFEMYIPMQRKVQATFAGPAVPRKRVTQNEQKLLGSFSKKKDDMA